MQSNLDINNPLTNLSTVPPIMGVVPIDTAENPPAANSAANYDVAGVLRRNQACLQCRRRKLKCDAARPHCATCIRSYRHLLRTAPRTNPTLCCDYDDGNGHADEAHQASSGSAGRASRSPDDTPSTAGDNGDDSATGTGGLSSAVDSGKKKRKRNREGRRRMKDEEFEEERDRLTKQIEQLQAQLATNRTPNPPPAARNDPSGQGWPQASHLFHPPLPPPGPLPSSASSPTAFLEILSSAASSAAVLERSQVQAQGQGQGNQGLHKNQNQTQRHNQMWGGGGGGGGARQQTGSTSFDSFSRRSSSLFDASPNNASASPSYGGTGGSSSGQSILSPNELFNFSPAAGGAAPDPAGSGEKTEPGERGGWAVESVTTATVIAAEPGAAVGMGFDIGSLLGMEMSETGNVSGMPDMPSLPGMGTTGMGMGGMGVDGDAQRETEINMDPLGAELDAAMQQQLLMDLFWPGWPAELPEPNVVNDLVEVFFDLAPNLPRLLHRPRFLARMALPPTHSNFPHPALIHAICAAAASWCSPAIYESSTRDKQWSRAADPDNGWRFAQPGAKVPPPPFFGPGAQSRREQPKSTFGLRQAAFAKDAVTEGLNTGNRLFDVVRAMIILCCVFMNDTRMLECWAYDGLVTRMILPLGLNVRSAEISLKSVMLPPPADALEREERRAAVWIAFYHDTISSAASGWGSSMSLDELTVPLPVSTRDFDRGERYMEPNPQDQESPDLWLKHPVVDSFVLLAKASILLNRTHRFIRKWKNRHLRPHDDFEGMERPEFKELANAIACFQLSFPAALRDFTKLNSRGRYDVDLIAAHMIPHAATICLYEAFADLEFDLGGLAARRLVSGTQGVIGMVQQLAAAVRGDGKRFATGMHSSTSVCLVTAARTSILFMRDALNRGDEAAAKSHRMDCEIIHFTLDTLGQCFKIGKHHAQLIQYFLDRGTNPTYENLKAHYPDHPRPGAPELTPDSDFGWHVQNALNIKRGFWRAARPPQSPPSAAQAAAQFGADSRSSSFAHAPGPGAPLRSGWGKGSPLGTGNTRESVSSGSGSGSGSGIGAGVGAGGEGEATTGREVRSASHASASLSAYNSPPEASALGGGAETEAGTGPGVRVGSGGEKDDASFELRRLEEPRHEHAAATFAYHAHGNVFGEKGNPVPDGTATATTAAAATGPFRAHSTFAIRTEYERAQQNTQAMYPESEYQRAQQLIQAMYPG